VATAKLPKPDLIFEEAADLLSREERFMATVSAMNALLIKKGVYSAEEFEAAFTQWARNEIGRSQSERDQPKNR
jgi:hypothetical protein